MTEVMPTRERLLEAAIQAIESGGEASLRIETVARAADITKPSIYHFFIDRDGLVAAAQAERYRRLLLNGLVESIELARAATTREEFEALLPVYVDIAMEPDGVRRRAERIQVLGSAVSRPQLTAEIIAVVRQALELVTELVRMPFDRGWASSAYDPDAIALWWLSVMQGRHLFDLVGDDRLHQQWRAIFLAQLRSLVFAAEA